MMGLEELCPCCVLPNVAIAFILGSYCISISAGGVLNFLHRNFIHPDGTVAWFLKWLHRIVCGFLLLFGLVLLLLANQPELRAGLFSSVCTRFISRDPALLPLRCQLAQQAMGRTMELGPGPGTNFKCWNNGKHKMTEWIGIEPNQNFAEAITAAKQEHRLASLPTKLVWRKGEELDIEAGSIDTVIGVHVLCSVDDMRQVLQEVERVLKPGGKFLFLEHVLDPDQKSWRGLVQKAIAPIFYILGNGCKFHHTGQELEIWAGRYGLDLQLEHVAAPIPLWPMKPHVSGSATKPQK